MLEFEHTLMSPSFSWRLRLMEIFRTPYNVERMGAFVDGGHARTANIGIPSFVPGSVRGRLIAVTDDIAGDWCLIEGNNRCVSFLSPAGASALNVEIIVGVCPAARTWSGW